MLKEKISFTLMELCAIEASLDFLAEAIIKIDGTKNPKTKQLINLRKKLIPTINEMHRKQTTLNRLPKITPRDRESR